MSADKSHDLLCLRHRLLVLLFERNRATKRITATGFSERRRKTLLSTFTPLKKLFEAGQGRPAPWFVGATQSPI
jgi:hypothetical protein